MTKKTQDKTKAPQSGALQLVVEKREVVGKKVRKLRREGMLPANIYGEGFESQAVMLPGADFSDVYKRAGETQIVNLAYQKKDLPVLIHNLQKHPVTGAILHADFRKVDLKKKIEAEVPLKLVGESEAVAQNKGVLQTIADTVSVEALPDKIPSEIEVDIAVLKEVDDEIKVSNLKTSNDYSFTDDAEKTLLRITEHKEEEVAPQIEEEVPEEEKETTPEEQETTAKQEEGKEEKKETSGKEDKGQDQKKGEVKESRDKEPQKEEKKTG